MLPEKDQGEAGLIRSFKDATAQSIFNRDRVRTMHPELQEAARRKLVMLDAAISLQVLGAVPGNRLEALGGDRKGQHSIRINRQWRICFRWEEDGAHDVEITDYH